MTGVTVLLQERKEQNAEMKSLVVKIATQLQELQSTVSKSTFLAKVGEHTLSASCAVISAFAAVWLALKHA